MKAKTRNTAKRASTAAGELRRLLDDLSKELSESRGDYAGYVLVNDVKEAIFGRNSDVLTKLSAVASMGEN
jgi:hypothetical protein